MMKGKIHIRSLCLLAGLVGLLILAYVPAGHSRHPGSTRDQAPAGLVAPARDSLDAQTGLVLAPGFQIVKNNCVRCHSPKLITTKRATREGWEATIRWMQLTQGLGDLGKEEAPILDYLAKHYAPSQQGRRPALKDITWYRLQK
jgi:hypothetical protein